MSTGKDTVKQSRSMVPSWIAIGIILTMFVAVGVHRVWIEFRILRLGLDKAEAVRLHQRLSERGRRLDVEIAATKDIERLTSLARHRHGMHYARKSERIVVRPTEKP